MAQRTNKLRYVLQFMPGFGTDDAEDHHHRDDVEGIAIDVVAREITLQHNDAGHRREPEQDAEGAQLQAADMDVRVHKPLGVQHACSACACSVTRLRTVWHGWPGICFEYSVFNGHILAAKARNGIG
jgi:hypothetical protein